MAFAAINASLPVPIGVAHPDTVKLVAYRVYLQAIVAPICFPAERAGAGAIFRFCVAGIMITDIGMGAVAVGVWEYPPVVLARVCFPICTTTDPAHGGRCAIRIPKVAAVFRLGVAGVTRADAGVGFYFRWASIRPSHAPAWNTRRTWCRGNSRRRALR